MPKKKMAKKKKMGSGKKLTASEYGAARLGAIPAAGKKKAAKK